MEAFHLSFTNRYWRMMAVGPIIAVSICVQIAQAAEYDAHYRYDYANCSAPSDFGTTVSLAMNPRREEGYSKSSQPPHENLTDATRGVSAQSPESLWGGTIQSPTMVVGGRAHRVLHGSTLNEKLISSRQIVSLVDTRDLVQAINDLSQIVASDNNNPHYYYLRALAFLKLGNSDRALADLTETLHKCPNHVDGLVFRAFLWNSKAEYFKSIVDSTAALALNSQHANAYHARCDSFRSVELYRRAIADCGKAIELDQTEASYYSSRALAKIATADYSGAETDLTSAISLAPDEPSYYFHRARALAGEAKYNDALENVGMFLTMNPADIRGITLHVEILDGIDRSQLGVKRWLAVSSGCIALIILAITCSYWRKIIESYNKSAV